MATDADLQTFVQVAKRYMQSIDELEPRNLQETARRLPVVLAELYASASKLLEQVRSEDSEEEWIEEELISEEWEPDGLSLGRVALFRQLFPRLQGIFGRWDCYWEYFDPYKEQDRCTGSLADDLSDIYIDVKDLVYKLEKAEQTGKQAKLDGQDWDIFQIHWGAHLVDALRALHRLVEYMEENAD
jgi:hypothetical protein